MAYTLRPFRPEDAPALAAITLSAIRTLGPLRYTGEQVGAWAARHPGASRFIERAAKGDWITIAADARDQAAAYTLLERAKGTNGHLDMLYCHPDHTRRGLAGELLIHAESYAKNEGMQRLFTEASELARPAFERAGYVVVNRRDFEIEGVAIHNYAMEKSI